VAGVILLGPLRELGHRESLGLEHLEFTNELGRPVQERTYRGGRRPGRPRRCRRGATPHDLRHFYASVLIRSGASVKVVQTRLGHASAKTTLDT
jgi:integrase